MPQEAGRCTGRLTCRMAPPKCAEACRTLSRAIGGAETRYNSRVSSQESSVLWNAQGEAPTPLRWGRIIRTVLLLSLLVTAGVFYGLHFAHLRADFPNNSPWSDWAKYTDEGWYGDAAIRHYLRGTWHLPGDFNPAAALPVWPLLEAVLFRFTGVGIVAARTLVVVVFGAILLCGFLLLRRGAADRDGGRPIRYGKICAAAGVLLMAVSPYFFVFSRMAVLEPLLVLLTLLALMAAGAVGATRERRTKVALEMTVGVLLALMIGTKTTAIALVPAIGWMLLSACAWRRRAMLRAAVVAGGTTLLPPKVLAGLSLPVLRQ